MRKTVRGLLSQNLLTSRGQNKCEIVIVTSASNEVRVIPCRGGYVGRGRAERWRKRRKLKFNLVRMVRQGLSGEMMEF